VNDVESFYYSLTAPSKGGQPLKALLGQSGAVSARPIQIPRIRDYRPRTSRR